MVGVIDEVQLPATETQRNPILVDTKTRVRNELPPEPQRRNGRYAHILAYVSLPSMRKGSKIQS